MLDRQKESSSELMGWEQTHNAVALSGTGLLGTEWRAGDFPGASSTFRASMISSVGAAAVKQRAGLVSHSW